MSESWEEIRDGLLEIVKDEAQAAWNEEDKEFIKERATEYAKLAAKMVVASEEEKEALRKEVRIEKTTILLRISRTVLRGGDTLQRIVRGVFSVGLKLLESKIPGLRIG